MKFQTLFSVSIELRMYQMCKQLKYYHKTHLKH